MDEKDKLKPLPKPVSAAPPRRAQTDMQTKPVPAPPPAPINPDDFEIIERQRRPVKPEPPSLGEALIIFFKRLRKKIEKSRTAPSSRHIPASQTPPRESKREAALRKKRRQQLSRLVGFVAIAVFIIAAGVFLVAWLTGKNAFEVTLGETKMGYIALSEEIDAAKMQSQMVNRLQETINASVQVSQTVTLKEVNIGRSNIDAYEEMVDLLSRSVPYKISALAIIVEGQEIAVLKSRTEVDMVYEKLMAPHKTEFTIDASFIESVTEETRLVDEAELGTVDDAFLQLDKRERVMEEYIIKKGDTLGGIANVYNTTAEKICTDTPNLTLETVLKIGQVINLETTKPYLSVRTIDEVKRTEVIPMQTEIQENPSQAKSYRRTIQEGRDGKEEVTVRITRVNGVLEKPEEEVGRVTVEQAVTRIVEEGTQETGPR
jgi:LysM repeat protein